MHARTHALRKCACKKEKMHAHTHAHIHTHARARTYTTKALATHTHWKNDAKDAQALRTRNIKHTRILAHAAHAGQKKQTKTHMHTRRHALH